MGLFRKKTDDPEQLDALRSEIVSLRERLDSADREKAELRDKVDTVDRVNAALYQRVDTVDQTNAVLYQRVDALDSTSAQLGQQVGAIGANATDLAGRVGVINDQVGSVTASVDVANDQANTVSTLGAQVQSLAHRLNTAPPPPPDSRIEQLVHQIAALSQSVARQGEAPLVDSAEVQALSARLDELSNDLASQTGRLDDSEQREADRDDEQLATPSIDADDVAAMRREMSQMAERMATLDHRMTSVSTELANQLTELSNDLDVLLEAADDPEAEHTDNSAAVTLAIEAVQTSTERLAAEQARYQIAFREDLAELAERLRRPTR